MPGPNQHPTMQINGGTRLGSENLMLQEWHYFFENTRRWRNLRKITIGMAHGDVYAAGLMLLWACDLIVAADTASFADVVGTRLGMCGVEYFAHPWEFGPRKAKELLLTGDSVSAEEAYQLGMVSKIFPGDELNDRTARVRPAHRQRPDHGRAAHQGVGQPVGRQHGLLQRAQRLLHPPRAEPLALGMGERRPLAGRQGGRGHSRTGGRRLPSCRRSRTRCALTANAIIRAAGGRDSSGPGGPVVRRAPFSDNPTVGPRGQRTQQRILEAALSVLRDEGYHRCSVDRIASLAGCSRVSFYQYFSGKEDVFYRLAGVVVAEVRASTLALEPLIPGPAGRESLRAWVAREADIYHRYGPVFNAFGAAAAGIDAVAELGKRASRQNIALIRSRLDPLGPAGTTAGELNAVIALLLGCLARTFQLAGVLRSAAPKVYSRARVEEALTDVLHRTLFGRDDVRQCVWLRHCRPCLSAPDRVLDADPGDPAARNLRLDGSHARDPAQRRPRRLRQPRLRRLPHR